MFITQIDDIILDAFLEYLEDDFIKSRDDAKKSSQRIYNVHFWEKARFISLDYIDPYGNIIHTETQPGTKTGDVHHQLSIATPQYEYKPFHDKWVKILNRRKNLDQLIDE